MLASSSPFPTTVQADQYQDKLPITATYKLRRQLYTWLTLTNGKETETSSHSVLDRLAFAAAVLSPLHRHLTTNPLRETHDRSLCAGAISTARSVLGLEASADHITLEYTPRQPSNNLLWATLMYTYSPRQGRPSFFSTPFFREVGRTSKIVVTLSISSSVVC